MLLVKYSRTNQDGTSGPRRRLLWSGSSPPSFRSVWSYVSSFIRNAASDALGTRHMASRRCMGSTYSLLSVLKSGNPFNVPSAYTNGTTMNISCCGYRLNTILVNLDISLRPCTVLRPISVTHYHQVDTPNARSISLPSSR